MSLIPSGETEMVNVSPSISISLRIVLSSLVAMFLDTLTSIGGSGSKLGERGTD